MKGNFNCCLKERGCYKTCSLPQWCSVCKEPHNNISELKIGVCKIAATCYSCETKLHDGQASIGHLVSSIVEDINLGNVLVLK